MFSYTLRRLLETIPVLAAVVVITFVLMQLVPGSVVDASLDERANAEAREAVRKRLGLDRPIWQQLGSYLALDFGLSHRHEKPARTLVWDGFLRTLRLAVAAMVFAVALGMAVGILAAVNRGGWVDRAAMILALVGISTPVFWLGMILMGLAVRVGWRDIIDDGSGRWTFLLLPAIALGTNSLAYIARMTRASMLEVLQNDYLRTARAKGLPERVVVLRHALRNALIPVITVVGLDFASYLTGAVLTESVFNYPGLGRTLIAAIADRNQPVILCGVALVTFAFILVNLGVDVLYGLADPRIRHARETT